MASKACQPATLPLRPWPVGIVDGGLEHGHHFRRRRGFILATRGQGKPQAMVAVARMLVEGWAFENSTVVMLADPAEPPGHLVDLLEAAGNVHFRVTDSIWDLWRLLRSDPGGIIVAQIRTFDVLARNVNVRNNILVLTGQVHPGPDDDTGRCLTAALPNATFIGFTDTPLITR